MSRNDAVQIRLAMPGDVSEIQDVVRRAYEIYLPRMGKPPAPMLDDYAALVRDRLVSVIDRHGRVAALIVLVCKQDYIFIDNIAVDPAFQGNGLGRRLLAAAEGEARRRSMSELRLYTNVAMTENISLYEHVGFKETHRAVHEGFQRVFMSKQLGIT
jgi:ribosomal protein S18 acetylase RimI-like enzyme